MDHIWYVVDRVGGMVQGKVRESMVQGSELVGRVWEGMWRGEPHEFDHHCR